jgi:hypothetical protein
MTPSNNPHTCRDSFSSHLRERVEILTRAVLERAGLWSLREMEGPPTGAVPAAPSAAPPAVLESVLDDDDEEMIEVELDWNTSEWEYEEETPTPRAAVASSCGGRLGWGDVLVCEECGKCCDSVREYMVHRGTIQCQIDAARQTFTRTDETAPTGAFECPDCLECFEWQRQLRHHRRGECPTRRARSTRGRATAERVREPVRAGVGKGGRGGEVVCVRAHVLVRV